MSPLLMSTADRAFRRVIDEARHFALILLNRDGEIGAWNAGAQELFGWEHDEVVGKHFSLLFTPYDCEREIPERELAAARENGRADDVRWHLRKDHRLFFCEGVTSVVLDDDGQLAGYAKLARDKTDRYLAEQRLSAQLALTSVLSGERESAITARLVMQSVCENLGWDVGALWDIEQDGIRCIDYWHAEGFDADAVRDLCLSMKLRRGEGLPGSVWESGAAAWVTDFTDRRDYPRAPLAARAGVRSAFAFPITKEGHVTGVMEFFSRVDREPDQALLPVMTLIGAQIGDYFDRRRTAQALLESEERYRVVVDTAQDAIFTIDESSRILFCNPAVEQVFGYKPEEILGRTLDIVIPERLREQHRQGMARFLRSRTRNIPWTGVELPAVHKNGHEFPCELSFGFWEEDDRVLFTGFARDITVRKNALEEEKKARAEAEAARAQLERRAEEEASFRHLASALTGAVEMSDVLYEITNRATLVTRADGVYVERIIDSDRQVEVVSSAGRGTPTRGTRVDYPGSMTEEILERRQPVILTDMKRFGRSMAPYLMETCGNCEVLVAPLVAEDEPLGALVLLNSAASGRRFRDSDVIRARTLGDMTSLALRRVRLMEQEREAKEKAEAAVRVRDETLGIVSHDLRNPLTKIALSADLLVDAQEDDRADLVETIRTASRQMERLIQDLLDVARLEAGRFSVEKSMLDPEPIVRYACESNAPIAQQKKLKIVCHIDAPLPEICADRDRLLQVFGNLVGNAMKFTPERGTITIEAMQRKGSVEFRVRDTGPGIPEADVKNVFRPYWQAKKTAHMGAGLGLAIVRGIVEAHGGKVWAENAAGVGAIFTFTIPLL